MHKFIITKKAFVCALFLLFCLALSCKAGATATSYPLSNSAFILSGAWSAQTVGGHSAQGNDKYSDEIDFMFTGTQLDMLARVDTSIALKYKLDGGPYLPLGNTGGAWATLNIVSGLADKQHSIVIKDSGGNNNSWYIDSAAGFTVTGASPAVTNPPNLNNSTILYLGDPSTSTHTVLEGGQWTSGGNPFVQNGYGLSYSQQHTGLDCAIRFYGQFSELWAYVSTNYTSTLNLRIADTPIGANNTSASPGLTGFVAEWVKITGGCASGYPHECTLSLGYTYPQSNILALSFVNGGAEFTVWTPTTKPYLVTYGDSFTQGSAVGNSALAYSNVLAGMLGLAVWQRGVSGTTVRNFTGTSGFVGPTPEATTLSMEARTADITGLSPAPPYVVFMGGTNDLYQSTENKANSGLTIGANGSGANFTPSQFGTSYTSVLNSIHTAYPSAVILCPSILPKSNDSSVLVGGQPQSYWRGLLNAAMQAACGSVSGAKYLNAETWLTQPTDYCEGWHPNASGYRKIALNLYKAASPAGGGTKRRLQ